MPTGQPRVHSSLAHVVSKNALGLSAAPLSGQNLSNSWRTAVLRSAGDIVLYLRQLSPPTKPKTIPGPPLPGGESSKVALTSAVGSSPVPFQPLSRQNGLS